MSLEFVYLAGPIAGHRYNETVDWRSQVAAALRDRGVDSLSPMRAKEKLKEDGIISSDFRHYAGKGRGPFYTSKGIMTRDFNDVKRSAMGFVYLLGTEKLTTGTVMELGWYYALQKPVVVVIEEDGSNIHDSHPMVMEAIGGLRFNNIEDAIDATLVVLGR